MIKADEVRKISDKAKAAEVRRARDRKKKEIEARKTADKRHKEVHLPFILAAAEKLITAAARAGHKSTNIVTQSNSDMDYIVDKLSAAGFKCSSVGYEHIPEYNGSADDYHAYAHNAYTEYTMTVSWK